MGNRKLNSFYQKAGGFLYIISMHWILTMLLLILMECNQIIYEVFAYAQVKFLDKSARPNGNFLQTKTNSVKLLIIGKTHLACIRDWHKWLSDFANRLDEMGPQAVMSLENVATARVLWHLRKRSQVNCFPFLTCFEWFFSALMRKND